MATPELRHMLRDDDLNHEEQKQVLELAIKFHKDRFYRRPFAGPQGIAVIFDKPSTRTRSSFSIGVAELGGYPLVIDKSGSQLGRGEPVADTARVLDRMAYGVVWRTFGQDRVEGMAKYSTHPVVNALTDEFHPCQILADFQTIAEHRGGVDNLRNQTIAYLGDAANNMANSYLLGGATAGMNVRIAGPFGYLPDPAIVADAERIAAETFDLLARTVSRMLTAGCKRYQVRQALVVGGVASSKLLRGLLQQRLNKLRSPVEVFFGAPRYSADNAAGVAELGLEQYRQWKEHHA